MTRGIRTKKRKGRDRQNTRLVRSLPIEGDADAPLAASALRQRCLIRNATLQAALAVLVAACKIRRDRAG